MKNPLKRVEDLPVEELISELAVKRLVLLPGTGSLLRHGKFELQVCGKCSYTKWFVAERFLEDIKEKGEFTRK